MQVESALLFESPEQLFARVFTEVQPRGRRGRLESVQVRFCTFANANSSIKLQAGNVEVRISDLLQGAPAPILEALAYILVSKLFRRPVPAVFNQRYRRYLNRKDIRHSLHQVRQQRGRKFISGPAGEYFNLEELFEELNFEFFHGLMARPQLGWSRRPSKTMLGHYDPSHNAIIISRILDQPKAFPALRYVLYHEMLHMRFPVDHRGIRRCVHTPEFRQAEKQFPELKRAQELLKKL
jgi:hypothetical protein